MNTTTIERFKRDMTLEERTQRCREMEYGTKIAGTVSDFTSDLGDAVSAIPIIGDIASIFFTTVTAVGHLAKNGMDIASTALNCSSIPFDEIKAKMDEQFNEVDRKLDKISEKLGQISKTVGKTLVIVEQTRAEMNAGFKHVVDTIETSIIKEKVDKINNIVSYFNDEKEKLRSLSKEDYVTQLMASDGILQYLKKIPTPHDGSLRTPLFELINNDFAEPVNANDEKAFKALYALFYGTQTYASIMFFLLEQHSYLADYHYLKGDYEEFNSQFDAMKNVFLDFKTSLVSGSNPLITNVMNLLNEVKNKIVIVNEGNNQIRSLVDELYQDLLSKADTLNEIKRSIEILDLPLIEKTPNPPVISFKNSREAVIGSWKDNSRVRYALQFEKEGAYSKIKWTEWKNIGGANPLITVPFDQQNRNRLIFRQFKNDDPQLVGKISSTQTKFKDINRDLFNAVMITNKNLALLETNIILKNGADLSATFEFGRNVIHAAAYNGYIKLANNSLLNIDPFLINKKDQQGFTPLHVASEADQKSFVNFLIKKGVDINAATNEAMLTALHLAAKNGFSETVETLTNSKNINVNAKDVDGFTPLHLAINSGEDTIKILLSKPKIDVNSPSKVGLTPLHLATINQNLDVIKLLATNENLKVNVVDNNGLSVLHYAVMTNNVALINTLISLQGIDPNIQAIGSNWTPLHFALYFQKGDVATEILKVSNINLQLKDIGDINPLHMAAATGQEKIVQELLKRNIALEERTKDGHTALHIAAMRENKSIAEMLVERGSNINAQTNDGSTPLHLAALAGTSETVSYFLNKGANIYVYDYAGFAPIYKAVSAGNLDVVKIFIDADPNFINMKNLHGLSLLDLASERLQKQVVYYLIKKGAPINVQNRYGMTPLHYFAKEGELDVVRFLIENGADVNIPDANGENFFYLAVTNGQLDVVKYAFEENVIDLYAIDNIKKQTSGISSSILYWGVCDALYYGKLDIIKYFVGTQNEKLCKPLQKSVMYGHLDVVKYLVEEENMDVNETDNAEDTALCNAIHSGDIIIVRYLIEKNANVYQKCFWRFNPVFYSMQKKQLKILKYLLEHGADPNKKDDMGFSAIHYSAMADCIPCAQYLITDKHVDVNARSDNNETALHIVGDYGSLDMAQLLLSNGADLYAKNSEDKTPLHLASEMNRQDMVNFLYSRYNIYQGYPSRFRFRRSYHMEKKTENTLTDEHKKLEADKPNPKVTWNDSGRDYYSNINLAIENLTATSEKVPSDSLITSDSLNLKTNSFSIPNIDINSSLLLFDVLLRKLTNEKLNFNTRRKFSELEAKAKALKIMDEFENYLASLGKHDMDEVIDLSALHSKIFKAIMRGETVEISKILQPYIDELN